MVNIKNAYSRLNWLSIFFIFMLFVIGGLVRSTGSGMGCPDWPKCFGEYVPPTSEDKLPDDYQEIFKEQRVKKTERFINVLNLLGFTEKAEEMAAINSQNDTHSFNVIKAYLEYINRLWGAITGLIVFLCFLASLSYFKANKYVFIYSLLGFFAVFINALLGAIVVNSNLIGGIVTVHFIAAFASIFFFILARNKLKFEIKHHYESKVKILALLLLFILLVQVVLGAELRELYDLLIGSKSFQEKAEAFAPTFQIHGIVGLLTLLVSIYQWIIHPKSSLLSKYTKWVFLLSIGQILFGPLALIDETEAISKLFHISLGSGIFVLQFYICTLLFKR